MLHVSRAKGYNLLRGSVGNPHGARNSTEGHFESQVQQLSSADVTHAWPHPRTLEQRNARPPKYDNGVHWSSLATFIAMSLKYSKAPRVSSAISTFFLASLVFDEQVLSQGAFVDAKEQVF